MKKRDLFSVIRLSRLLLIEQIREPVGLFWSTIAPPLLFTLLNNEYIKNQPLSVDWYISKSGWYLSYIAITVSLFGFALYFIGRRESGFVKSFIVGKKLMRLFIFSQFITSVILALGSYIIFIVITATISNIDILSVILVLFLPFVTVLVLTMFGALSIAALPITFQNAGSGISIFSAVMLILSISGNQSNSYGIINILNQFNPLHIWANYLSEGGHLSPEQLILSITLCILGLVGYRLFRIAPVWSRQ